MGKTSEKKIDLIKYCDDTIKNLSLDEIDKRFFDFELDDFTVKTKIKVGKMYLDEFEDLLNLHKQDIFIFDDLSLLKFSLTIDMRIARKCVDLKKQEAYKDLELDEKRGYISPELFDIASNEVEQELLNEIQKELHSDIPKNEVVALSEQDEVADLLKAVADVQDLKDGIKENVLLSNHQIINMLVSLQVAKEQLDEVEYKKVCDLWNEYNSAREKKSFNISQYINHSIAIISKFEEITPYYNITDDESSRKLREEHKKEKETKIEESLKPKSSLKDVANNDIPKDFVSMKTVKKLLFSFVLCFVFIGVVAYSQWEKNKTLESQISELTDTNETLETKLTKTKKELHEYQNKYTKIAAENSELDSNRSEDASILNNFDDSRRTDGTMSVSKNVVVLSEYESTDIKVSLDEYGSWTVYSEQTGYSAYGEWGDSESGVNHFKITGSNLTGCTLFKFTNSRNSDYVEVLAIVK